MKNIEIDFSSSLAKKGKAPLNKPFRLPSGSKKKFGVYVKNDKGNIVKVTFGDPNMSIKRDNPEREAYQSVIRKLVEMGIPEKDAEKLIDLHPDWEDMDYIIFGFMTNDEILSIATYDKIKKKLFFERNDLIHAVEYYQQGECNGYLE